MLIGVVGVPIDRRHLLGGLAAIVAVSGSGLVISSFGADPDQAQRTRPSDTDQAQPQPKAEADPSSNPRDDGDPAEAAAEYELAPEPLGASDTQTSLENPTTSQSPTANQASSIDTGPNQLDGDLTVADGTITTDDGYLKTLTTSITGELRYTGLERAANSIDLQLFAAPHGGNLSDPGNRIANQNHLITRNPRLRATFGSLGYEFTEADMLAADDLSSELFSAPDGDATTTTIDVRLSVIINDSNGDVILNGDIATAADVTVVNDPEGATTTGNGSISGA